MMKGGGILTVGDKLHQTLSSLESAKAQLETFGLETKDKQAQQMYNTLSSQLNQVVSQLKGRVNYVEGQEPQYKVRQQANQQATQQTNQQFTSSTANTGQTMSTTKNTTSNTRKRK